MPHFKTSRQVLAAALGAVAIGLSALALSPAPPHSTPAEHGPAAGAHAKAQHTAPGTLPLQAQGATVVAVPPIIKETSVFATLINTGRTPIVLKGVSAEVAAHGMLMVTGAHAGMVGMSRTPTLTVPAGGRLILSATGSHLMLMGLKRPLKVGETLTLTLSAADGRTFSMHATVRKP
jgi:copper(I)-binding protein